jgi:hypothetical protein
VKFYLQNRKLIYKRRGLFGQGSLFVKCKQGTLVAGAVNPMPGIGIILTPEKLTNFNYVGL